MSKILILGGDSDFNLGDAAILEALCERFAVAGAAEIAVTSSQMTPRPIRGVTAVLRRGFSGSRALFATAAAADLVVVGGGGLFQDDDSRIKLPYWAARLAALRLVNPRIVGHCIGAGPIRHVESRWFARSACSNLQSISVRDRFAQRALTACTAQPVDVVPDPAFMLDPAARSHAESHLHMLGIDTRQPIIGVSLRSWFHTRGGFIPQRLRAQLGMNRNAQKLAMKQFIAQFAIAIEPLARELNATLLLLPTYTAAYENDTLVCEALANALPGRAVKIAKITDPRLYKAVTGCLSVMISSRMHPLILAAGMGTPLVGLAYNGKFEGLFDLLGLPKRLIWINEFATTQPESLTQLAIEAMTAKDNVRQRAANLGSQVSARTAELLATCAGATESSVHVGTTRRSHGSGLE